MTIYSVHRLGWAPISEVELVTLDRTSGETHWKTVSASWPYGQLILAGRELDRPGEVKIHSVWQNGERIVDHGPDRALRRVCDSPHWYSPPQP